MLFICSREGKDGGVVQLIEQRREAEVETLMTDVRDGCCGQGTWLLVLGGSLKLAQTQPQTYCARALNNRMFEMRNVF